jgi:PhnB protein
MGYLCVWSKILSSKSVTEPEPFGRQATFARRIRCGLAQVQRVGKRQFHEAFSTERPTHRNSADYHTGSKEGLVRFVKKAFQRQGEFHLNRPSEIRIGDSVIMISDGDGLRKPFAAIFCVYVENVDETYRRAIKAGAEILEVPSDQAYGDRRAMVKDDWDNLWQIASQNLKK